MIIKKDISRESPSFLDMSFFDISDFIPTIRLQGLATTIKLW